MFCGIPRQSAGICLLWLLLLTFVGQVHPKSASDFSPASQTLNMGLTITIYGTRLTSADTAMVALGIGTGGVGCGSAQTQPVALKGCESQRLMSISSDGTSGSFRATPGALQTGNVICIQFFPSKAWQRVGSGVFTVLPPSITSISSTFGAGNGMTIMQYEPFTLTVTGTGMVKSLISLKISSAPCSSDNRTDISGGEPKTLEWANSAGSQGMVSFTLFHRSSASTSVAVCMSYPGQRFFSTVVTSASLVVRTATSFINPGAFVPGVASTITVTGEDAFVCACA